MWDGKKDKVKRLTVIQNFQKGGLNIRDVVSHIDMLRISWVKRYCDKNNSNWKIIPNIVFEKYGDQLLFVGNMRNINMLPNTKEIPEFYLQILESWFKLNKNVEKYSNSDIKNQILWGNQNILFNNKVLFYTNWIDSGIIHVNDILNNGKIDQNMIS